MKRIGSAALVGIVASVFCIITVLLMIVIEVVLQGIFGMPDHWTRLVTPTITVGLAVFAWSLFGKSDDKGLMP